jgi:hypothetical protein
MRIERANRVLHLEPIGRAAGAVGRTLRLDTMPFESAETQCTTGIGHVASSLSCSAYLGPRHCAIISEILLVAVAVRIAVQATVPLP